MLQTSTTGASRRMNAIAESDASKPALTKLNLPENLKSLAAWLAPQVPNFPAWYRYSRDDSVLVITIQSIRTRMGPLNRISPANTWQARRRPWGALNYGEVRAESAADAYLALTRK